MVRRLRDGLRRRRVGRERRKREALERLRRAEIEHQRTLARAERELAQAIRRAARQAILDVGDEAVADDLLALAARREAKADALERGTRLGARRGEALERDSDKIDHRVDKLFPHPLPRRTQLRRAQWSYNRPRARARRARVRAAGPRSGQDPGDEEGDSEPPPTAGAAP